MTSSTHYRGVKLDKFRQGRTLPNKRAACQPIIHEVLQLVKQKTPKAFTALVMPSATMFDVDLLTNAGVPECNIVAVENDSESFNKIRSSSEVDLTDAPVDLQFRLRLERERFDWINLDLCGFLQPRWLSPAVALLAKQSFRGDTILSLTVKCAREHKSFQHEMWELAAVAHDYGLTEASNLQQARESALFVICCMIPASVGWYASKAICVKYREDRQNDTMGSLMTNCGVIYSQQKTDLIKKWQNGWIN